mmetsp:Transcript_2448/g.6818  ORF Transcript_2448/g.6818 Transcript_2448/m.6818 type:complete len:215 (+) Transcript_2448:236-880(+)
MQRNPRNLASAGLVESDCRLNDGHAGWLVLRGASLWWSLGVRHGAGVRAGRCAACLVAFEEEGGACSLPLGRVHELSAFFVHELHVILGEHLVVLGHGEREIRHAQRHELVVALLARSRQGTESNTQEAADHDGESLDDSVPQDIIEAWEQGVNADWQRAQERGQSARFLPVISVFRESTEVVHHDDDAVLLGLWVLHGEVAEVPSSAKLRIDG